MALPVSGRVLSFSWPLARSLSGLPPLPFAPCLSAVLGFSAGGKRLWGSPGSEFLHCIYPPTTSPSTPPGPETAWGGLSGPQWERPGVTSPPHPPHSLVLVPATTGEGYRGRRSRRSGVPSGSSGQWCELLSLPFPLFPQAPVSVWEEEEDGATFTVTSRQYRPPDPSVRSRLQLLTSDPFTHSSPAAPGFSAGVLGQGVWSLRLRCEEGWRGRAAVWTQPVHTKPWGGRWTKLKVQVTDEPLLYPRSLYLPHVPPDASELAPWWPWSDTCWTPRRPGLT